MNDRRQSTADPAPEAEWQVWYEDMFDREAPRSVEASGRGLVKGLVELWTRHLRETVRPDGKKGFSRFNLWWTPRSVDIVGDWEGAVRLRGWVFGTQGKDNRSLLNRVAAVHAHLIVAGQSSQAILETAVAAQDLQDFEARLVRLNAIDAGSNPHRQQEDSMNASQKLQWLRLILLVKVIATFALWGLPALFGPPVFLSLFGLAMPEDPLFLRLFGAVVTAFGVGYWYAYRDPIKNIDILRAGVADNGLVTVVIVVLGLTVGVSSWFIWLSAVLTGLFCLAFLVLMPKEE